MRQADRIVAGAALALAGLYFWGVSAIRVPRVGDPLGPRAFPILIGIGAVVSAIMLIVESSRNKPADRDAPQDVQPANLPLVGGVALWTAIYILAFVPLGYLLSTFLFLAVLALYFHRGSRLVGILSAAGFALATYLLFNRLLGARLPHGILPF